MYVLSTELHGTPLADLATPCNVQLLLDALHPEGVAVDVTRSLLWPRIVELYGGDIDLRGFRGAAPPRVAG